ncbi:sce7726 family protein [Flavobacterium nitrogenifigens]|uniref:Sce7726 family protein n=1 Tax=Flavobacterium nitrogenifigens TaxID=1617283 RepID=A0A521AFX8_9FLAO|nr:sce7726 family protein [Flavobacterium nitrogenifigens]KAF2331502.1 sce7726 family protein [Flavobacterium nitrogenifigens]SMO33715.1 hypothetical protein SAMN06265220_101101 [Flavobacterium nitrogenifigens]
MKDKIQNKDIDKMRSYSSIFSSSYFSNLLQHDDYSFIDDNILQYDQLKIGKSFKTYYEYIRYIYNELTKQYRNEYVYKNTFITELLINSYGVKNTIALSEFKVGNSIADIVLFNGTSKAFEIKTELDSRRRLNGQLMDYRKIFKECYVIIHEAFIDDYLIENDSVGVIVLERQKRSLKMREIRKAKENLEIDSDALMHCIRTEEYKTIILEYFGELPKMNSFNMFEICRELMREIPSETLHNLFIEQLKKRKSNTKNLAVFQKELRQLGLSMNINNNLHEKLLYKLNKPIPF